MRNAVLTIVVLLAVLAVATPVASAGVGGGCVRTYARGYGEGTYVYSSNSGAIGFGVEENLVGSGAAVFFVVQPSNCGSLPTPDLDEPSGSGGPGVEPVAVPHLVLP